MKRNDSKELFAEIEQICKEGGVDEPARFLASVMTGSDPREPVSPLYRMFLKIGEDPPTPGQWRELRDLVLGDPAYKPTRVSFTASAKAAKSLLEYLHPKLKSTEVSARLSAAIGITAPLSPEDVQTFEDWFSGEF
jgi:hypothetical protein